MDRDQSGDRAERGASVVFVFSPPRSGSTMLQWMLDAHSQITSLPEPHVMVPLGYLGYFAKVDQAPYDVINSSLALREFVDSLPGGEASYVQACRNYAASLYADALTGDPAARLFVDKTPANVLQWRFVTKVFPDARYIVLTRHPLAVINSLAETFFMGDWELMSRQDRGLQPYVEAIAAFLAEASVKKLPVKYEDLVADPEGQARRLAELLEVPFEPAMVDYGQTEHRSGSLGDPTGAKQFDRPVPGLNDKWVQALASDPKKLQVAEKLLARLGADELAAYGYAADELLAPLDEAAGATGRPRRAKRFSFYGFKRRVFFILQRWARWGPMRKLLESIRYYCDVLLRQ